MPGHKRNGQAGGMAQYYGIDITEIDGFDNLHQAQGILLRAQQRANRLYGAEETFYLVNGSTSGVLAAVLTAAAPGEAVLAARNCHKSVYHAAVLQGLRLYYTYPALLGAYGIYGGVSARDIGDLLERHPDCRAVVITSPTYEGIISDIEAIARTVHRYDRILIVDEAHGAHLGLPGDVPQGAVAGGADLVIHSLHKTLPSMTQTALLHVQGKRVDRRRLRRYLAMVQTSSPSYVMMASMDSCIRYMEVHGAERFAFMRRQYDLFCRKMEKCTHIRIGKLTNVSENLTAGRTNKYTTRAEEGSPTLTQNMPEEKHRKISVAWDIGKLVIFTCDCSINGQQLYDILRETYHLQMEMAAGNYVLAIMTVMDTEEGWQRLADALLRIDDRIEKETAACFRENIAVKAKAETDRIPGDSRQAARTGTAQTDYGQEDCRPGREAPQRNKRQPAVESRMSESPQAEIRMTPADAFHALQEEVPLAQAVGRTMGDFVNLYPPGIPLLVPGEVMSETIREKIQESMDMGLNVQGVSPEGNVTVLCKT